MHHQDPATQTFESAGAVPQATGRPPNEERFKEKLWILGEA